MRGAAHLSSAAGDGETAVLAKNAIVVDIGGTSTDVGQLVNGFPREAGSKVEIGGVYTNFRMPDLYSIGLGGGSLVKRKADHNGFSVGPLSVGNRLLSECQSLGGKTLTATDVVIKAEIYNGLKDADTSKIGLSDKEAEWVLESMKEMVEAAVDCIKVNRMILKFPRKKKAFFSDVLGRCSLNCCRRRWNPPGPFQEPCRSQPASIPRQLPGGKRGRRCTGPGQRRVQPGDAGCT